MLSLFIIIFSFWCFFPKSLLLTFHSRVSLKSWLLVLLSLRPLTFFRLSFWLPFLLSFFPSKLISSCQVESLPSYFPSWFFFLSSSRYQPFTHELLVSKLSSSFLHHGVADRDVSIFVPCVSWYSFWVVLISSWLGCTSRGFRAPWLAVPRYPGPVLTTGLPRDFLTLVGWDFFLLPFVSWILRPIHSWVWVLP